MNRIINNKQGFTMVELLVVISIMGFIMAAATYSVQAARMKARDTKRIADLSQIRKALDMYFNDNNKYPDMQNPDGSGTANSGATLGAEKNNWNLLKIALKPYLGNLPGDPLSIYSFPPPRPFDDGKYAYQYMRTSDNKYYNLITQLEERNNPNICKYKCHIFYSSVSGGAPWCSGGGNCIGGFTNSDYLYADH